MTIGPDFSCGSWLCENADAGTDCATTESGRSGERIIVAAKSGLMNQYFISDSEEFVFTQLIPTRIEKDSRRGFPNRS